MTAQRHGRLREQFRALNPAHYYVEMRLLEWARHAGSAEQEVGYATTSITERMSQWKALGVTPERTGFIPDRDIPPSVLEVERAVCQLPPYLRETCREAYLKPGPVQARARRLGIATNTYDQRLGKIRRMVAEKLSGV